MPFISREQSLARLRDQVVRGRPIIGAGAGTGISAKFAERGEIDIIIIYNSGRYRMAGRGSLAGMLPYGDANAIVVEMGYEVLPVVKHTPVLAGVCGTDPFRLMPVFLRQLKEMGFDGVQNFPTVGLFEGMLRAGLEETGMGYGLEVDMIGQAHALGLLTCPYIFNEDDARAMTAAGSGTTNSMRALPPPMVSGLKFTVPLSSVPYQLSGGTAPETSKARLFRPGRSPASCRSCTP